jgi:hypothetical protein
MGRRVFVSFACAGLLALSSACGGGSSPAGPTPSGPTPAQPTPAPTPAARTAHYVVTFDATWSDRSHPEDFPSNAHWSPLVGATHSPRASFWASGGLASAGIELMAERGRTSPLDAEVRAAIAQGTAQNLILGGGISRSPGSVSTELDVSVDFPLVTLVSMVAPSPDWFTGVHDLDLIENGDWAREKVVTLYAYDAGTDSGVTYASADLDTQPREPIERIDGRPLAFNGSVAPVGTFTFRRLSP